MEKEFPDGMVPLGDSEFKFDCHMQVSCFTVCCKDVDMTLYPYDIICLKNCLGMDSEEFVRTHTCLIKGENPYFPTVKLTLTEGSSEKKHCPFLTDTGCGVYGDRPSACRTYPLERAVGRAQSRGKVEEFYFLTNHPYCKGHKQQKTFTVAQWIRNQRLIDYNTANSLWAEIDTIFATNPWKGEGAAGEKQQLAFMVCYNIDGFRRFCQQHKLIDGFKLEKSRKRSIGKSDSELQKFGFDWLKLILTGKGPLIKR